MSITHEQRVTRLALAGGVPALVVALWLLWSGDYASRTQWTLSVVVIIAWLAFAFAAWERVIRPLQTLSNMLAALRERDYSLRARRQGMDDALGLVIFELNVLTEELKQRRLGSLEATALLERVMSEIDVAVFTFDADDALQLVNAASGSMGRTPAGSSAAARTSWGWRSACREKRPECWSSNSPRRGGVGRFAGGHSGRRGSRTSSSSSRMSAGPCAKRSVRPGSD